MSTLKVDTIEHENATSAIDMPNKFKVSGTGVEQGYTSSETEPTGASTGDIWWDSANEKIYRYIDGEFKELTGATGGTPVFNGATQGVFNSTQNEQINIAMPTGTQSGDYAMLFVGGLTWQGSSAVTVDNGDFGSPTSYQWGYGPNQSNYMVDVYTDSSISSALVNSGVNITNNDAGTEYKMVTLLTFRNTTPLVAHTQIDYSSQVSGNYYQVQSGTRPTGYDSLSGGGIIEVHTTREGNRTYVDANDGTDYSDFLSKVQRSNVYIQAVYQNYETHGYGQPYHRFLYSSGTTYSSSSIVIAWGTSSSGSGSSATFSGDRGLFIAGNSRDPITVHNVIDYVDIATAGNATDFGDASYGTGEYNPGGASNGSRGVFTAGEVSGSSVNTIHYVTINTTGNSVDFGDMTATTKLTASSSDGTYGLFWNGQNNMGNISYVTIDTTGNATSFGTTTYSQSGGQTGAASGPTRNFGFGSATSGHSTYGNIIEYVTVQTPGNATDFGDLTGGSSYGTSASDNTRVVIAHGWDNTGASVVYSNVLDYITQDTTGNATDFGDLTIGRMGLMGTANATRGVFGGGYSSGLTTRNVIDYITIQTTGNATDFGDLTVARSNGGSLSGAAS